MLADGKFARLGEMDERYFINVRRVRTLADSLGLEIVPAVFPIGRSNSLLAHDPNLAEGLPVRNALFVVHGGEARPEADPPVHFGPAPDRVDRGVVIERGIARIRDPRRLARFMYRVRVTPFRCYHVSVAIETEAFGGTPLVQVLAEGRPIQFIKSLGVAPSQGWTTHDVSFNSLGHREVAVYFGVWGSARGSLAWKDWRIEEAGLLNVLRRAGAPCVVDGLTEGKDYERVRDERLGMTPWRGQYDRWHEPPAIGTTFPDGARLRVSWYQPAVFYDGQVTCCLSEPAVLDLLRDEARRVREAWGARGYLMQYDEIRSMNWDESCRRRHLTPGRILAEHVRRAARLLEGSTVYVWNDMFDPYHNAVSRYYLVNGDLAGSWEGLGRDIVIVNWNAPRKNASLRFFARRGHRQIIAGYFDGKPEAIREWLLAASGVPGVIGVMYTTWRPRWDDLEAFARACGVEGRGPRTQALSEGGARLGGAARSEQGSAGGPGQMTPTPGEAPRKVGGPESRPEHGSSGGVPSSAFTRSACPRGRAGGRGRRSGESAGHEFRDTGRWRTLVLRS